MIRSKSTPKHPQETRPNVIFLVRSGARPIFRDYFKESDVRHIETIVHQNSQKVLFLGSEPIDFVIVSRYYLSVKHKAPVAQLDRATDF